MTKLNQMYDEAVKGGYKGTRTEFIASVKKGEVPDYDSTLVVIGKKLLSWFEASIGCFLIGVILVITYAGLHEWFLTASMERMPWWQALQVGVAILMINNIYHRSVYNHFRKYHK